MVPPLRLTKFKDSDWNINHIGSFAVLRPARVRAGSPPSEEFRACPFHTCREQFQRVFFSSGILFIHGKQPGEHVFAFIQVVERRLNLNKKTTAGPTQRNVISWFEVSPFWMSEPMRKSLFTALLRGGLNYHPRTASAFSHAVESQRYLRETKFALKRFLGGYTHFTGRAGGVRGWHETFGPRDRRFYEGGRFIWKCNSPPEETIEKMLVKPKKDAM